MKRITLLLLPMVLCLATQAPADVDRIETNATVQEFNQSLRAVRQEFIDYPNYSLKIDDIDHACLVPAALRRLAISGETFRIRKVHTKYDHFRIEFETPGKTRLKVSVYDRGELSQSFLDVGLRRILNDVFVFGPSPPPVSYVGHRESRLLHLDRCNHLPDQALREQFATRDDGMAAGYRDCPICFGNTANLPYPGYVADRTAGLQSAKAFELVYPLATDPQLQRRLDDLGQTVLERWPMELTGFEYDFRVVHADQPLAASFATGIVVVSDTMLEAAEADEEILFVLAHEIAHCELHLPPRSPFMGEQLSPLDRGYLNYLFWWDTTQFAADLVAVNWFQCQADGPWQLARARSALAKVQQAVGAVDDVRREPGMYENLHERLWLFETERFLAGDMRRVCVAEDNEGDVRYELRFLGLMKREKMVQPCFLLTTTDYQEKADYSGFGSCGEISDAGGRVYSFEAETWAAIPGYTTLVVGETKIGETMEDFVPASVDKFMLYRLEGAKTWRRDGVEFESKVVE